MMPYKQYLQLRNQHLKFENQCLKAKLNQLKTENVFYNELNSLFMAHREESFEETILSVNEQLTKLVVMNPECEAILEAKLSAIKVVKDLESNRKNKEPRIGEMDVDQRVQKSYTSMSCPEIIGTLLKLHLNNHLTQKVEVRRAEDQRDENSGEQTTSSEPKSNDVEDNNAGHSINQ